MKEALYLILVGACFSIAIESRAQGCVAVRSFSGSHGEVGSEAFLAKGQWIAVANFRTFHSYRHFSGKNEHAFRVEQGTEVINDSFFLDLSITHGLTDRLFGTFTLPVVYHERSSMYEHGGNPPNGPGDRHRTYAQGLGDIRFSLGYWALHPEKNMSGNFSIGLGVKLPTGDYGAESTFYNQGPDRAQMVALTVDQSIQPGDGGLGATFDFQGYKMISHSLLINGTFNYLVNPRETNGESARNGGTEFSVPDQYSARLGLIYISSIKGLSLYLGGRHECIPVYDLLGGSDGFRRPGYIISLEPGVSYSWSKFALNINVPIALERNRTQSYLDKKNSTPDNIRHGDAAFADYLISLGFSWRIAKKEKNLFNIL